VGPIPFATSATTLI